MIGVGLLIGALLGVAGCSGSDSSSSATPTSTTVTDAAPGKAKVTSLEVPASVDCGGATSTKVRVSYATEGAEKQELYLDGRLVPGADAASATVDVPIHCDSLPHDVVVVAYDDAGRRTASEKKLTTNL